jgi:thiol-disulfide isomerase/thioredoxin
VLIDFWATWCPPCNRDLDYIQSLASEFSKDNFVLLGVSSDSKESDWTRYVEKNHMLGIQVRDSFEGLNSLFHVAGIPTYIVIDANGIIRLRVTGPEGDIRGKIRTLLINRHPPLPSHATAQLAIPPPHPVASTQETGLQSRCVTSAG